MASLPINNSLLSRYEMLKYKRFDTCRKPKNYVQNLNPYITGLSNYSSLFNTSIKVYVYGEHFLPNGLTSIDFGNIKNIKVTYINANTIYFELYNFAFPGVYNIIVKNNLHFSARNITATSVNIPPFTSNIIQYTIIR
jgi:hypothetical protein